MSDLDFLILGPAQIAALMVLLQRGLEELHSARNTRKLIAQGAKEYGKEYYPVVAATHLGWIAAIFFFVPKDALVFWPALIFYLLLQVLRYWIISSLGKYWTHRIISLENAPIVVRGPYAFVRHPNYLTTYLETFLLPICFGAYEVALIFGVLWWVVIRHKIFLEDETLRRRRR